MNFLIAKFFTFEINDPVISLSLELSCFYFHCCSCAEVPQILELLIPKRCSRCLSSDISWHIGISLRLPKETCSQKSPFFNGERNFSASSNSVELICLLLGANRQRGSFIGEGAYNCVNVFPLLAL
jgi:hypothetical protein